MKKRHFLNTVVVSLAAAGAGCITVGSKSPHKLDPADYDETIRVACVGDSITFGAGIRDRKNHNYPLVMGKSLGGWVAARLVAELDEQPAGLVL